MMILPNKALGQHFLIKDEIVEKIISASGVIHDHNIIEIGPGNGVLTEAILAKTPLSLVAIEKDIRFKEKHLHFMQSFSNYKIIINDVLKTDLINIVNNPKKIIANIPYNISNELISKIINSKIKDFTSITLMVQKEVAIKILTGSKIGFLLRAYADVKYLFEVDKNCFYPKPKIQSAVILITPNKHYKNDKYLKNIRQLISVLFNKKRKVLKSTLMFFFADPESVLNRLNIDSRRRVETLSSDELYKIAMEINDV